MTGRAARILTSWSRVGGQRATLDDVEFGSGTTMDAFDSLYRLHSIHVFRYLRSRVATDDEAAELAAVTFERAIRSHHRFVPSGGGERAWLLRIARNAAIDAARASARTVVGRDVSRVAGTARLEQLVELRILVGSLPDVQRDAVLLRYAAGLTAAEIGSVLGKSEAAAQKTITRALAALREAYRDGT